MNGGEPMTIHPTLLVFIFGLLFSLIGCLALIILNGILKKLDVIDKSQQNQDVLIALINNQLQHKCVDCSMR